MNVNLFDFGYKDSFKFQISSRLTDSLIIKFGKKEIFIHFKDEYEAAILEGFPKGVKIESAPCR